MNNRFDNEYKDSEVSVNEESWTWALPEDLYEPDIIDWLLDEIDVFGFHSDEEFLDFVMNSWFDKIYYISVYPNEIEKYKDKKSVYDLLSRCKGMAWLDKLELVIFRRWKDKYLSKEEADKFISDYANAYLSDSEKARKEISNMFKDDYDVSNLSDENVRETLVEALNQEPHYSRIISNWWKYKYLVWWWKWSKANSWKYYIDILKHNWMFFWDLILL